MTSPPKEWFDKQEAAAKEYEKNGETVAAETLRNETAAIAKKYAEGAIDAQVAVVEDLCDLLPDDVKQALENVFTEIKDNKCLFDALKAVFR